MSTVRLHTLGFEPRTLLGKVVPPTKPVQIDHPVVSLYKLLQGPPGTRVQVILSRCPGTYRWAADSAQAWVPGRPGRSRGALGSGLALLRDLQLQSAARGPLMDHATQHSTTTPIHCTPCQHKNATGHTATHIHTLHVERVGSYALQSNVSQGSETSR